MYKISNNSEVVIFLLGEMRSNDSTVNCKRNTVQTSIIRSVNTITLFIKYFPIEFVKTMCSDN